MTPAAFDAHPSHLTTIGGLPIHRALPVRGRRRIGPWCFLDRFGPLSFEEGRAMDVGAHPHMGLQTVSYLLEGEVLHHDSLGCEAVARPGTVNVMTAGAGIAHAEESPAANSGRLHGVQLWVALPDADRNVAPGFQHVPDTPLIDLPGGTVRVFAGAMRGEASAARHYSELLGADVRVGRRSTLEVPLDSRFEHGVLVLGGETFLDGVALARDTLYAAGPGRASIELRSEDGARVLLLGGPPFAERILMWWNFVARDMSEIRAAREAWATGDRFGHVAGFHGARIEAPPLAPGSERLTAS